MEDKTLIAIAGLVCLTIIECAALNHGINGQLFLAVLVVIAGVVGVPLGYHLKEKVAV